MTVPYILDNHHSISKCPKQALRPPSPVGTQRTHTISYNGTGMEMSNRVSTRIQVDVDMKQPPNSQEMNN